MLSRPGPLLGAVVLGVAVFVALGRTLAYGLVRSFLGAPSRCSVNSGCVDTQPLVAGAVMFGFDVLLLATVVWHLRDWRAQPPAASRLVRPDRPGRGEAVWWLGVAAIVLAALAVRGYWADASSFRWDEVDMSWLALSGLLRGRLALTGIDTTARIPNMAGSVYLVAPLLVPFESGPGSEGALLVFVALLSALTAALCAGLVRRWTGSTAAALAAGAAYAVGFWPVFTGRRVWQNDFMPPLMLLFLDAVLVVGVRRQGRAFVWATVWLCALVQMHYVALALVPVLAVAAWFGRRGLRLGELALGLGLPTLLAAPFLYWEFSIFNFLRDLRQVLVIASQPSTLDATSGRLVMDLATTDGLEWWVGPPDWPRLVAETSVPRGLAYAGLALLALGAAACAWSLVRGTSPGRAFAGVLLGALALPVVLLAHHSVEVYWWYFFPWLPAVAILIGLGVVTPARALSRLGRRACLLGAGVGVVALLGYGVGSTWVLQDLLVQAATGMGMVQYEPVGPTITAGRLAAAAWRTESTEPLLIGARSRDVERLWLSVGASTPVQSFDDCVELPGTRTAKAERIYFLRDGSPAVDFLERAPGARLVQTVPRAQGESPFRVFAVAPNAFDDQTFPHAEHTNWPDCVLRGE